MLVEGLRAGLHVPPHVHAGWAPSPSERTQLAHAPKITTDDKRLRFGTLDSAAVIERQARTLGALWCTINNPKDLEVGKLMKLNDITVTTETPPVFEAASEFFELNIGTELKVVELLPENDGRNVWIRVSDKKGHFYLRIGKVTTEGKSPQHAWSALKPFTYPK